MTPTCCKLLLSFFLLFWWIEIPKVFGDVVPVSVTQQVSIDGIVFACDGGCEMGYGIQDNGATFSLAKSNTQLPSMNLSQAGSATDSLPIDPFFIRSASVDASASQTSALNPTNFNLDLSVSGDLSGSDSLMSGYVSANSQYSLVFNLNTPSLVHLTGQIGGASSSFSDGPLFLDGLFDGEIHLSGPGTQFDQVLSFPLYTNSFDGQSFDQSFTLDPGQYTIDAVSGLNGDGYYFLDSNSSFELSLNADFSPAVPEPARVSTFLGLLMLVGLFFARRRSAAGFRE